MAEFDLRENAGGLENEGRRSTVKSVNINCWPTMRENATDLDDQRGNLVSAGTFDAAFQALSKALSSNTK